METRPQANPPGVKRQWAPPPVFRHLRVFAVDPSIAARFETGGLNEETLSIPWELLARQGLTPSDGDPRFRHQMVYAVAMQTIRNFERALGRPVHWPPVGEGDERVYRRRLNLYPHHSSSTPAYYDRLKGLCFGYFEADEKSPFPGTVVFTCLSRDVIAHELTHALLEGMNIQVGSGGDYDAVLAFHQGFSTIVPFFQHFRSGDVLRHQISAVRGDLRGRSLLGVVAPQLAEAQGSQDGVSNVFGTTDEHGSWQPRKPDPKLYAEAENPYERGGVLV